MMPDRAAHPEVMSIVIRHAEPGDFEAVQSIFEAPEAIAGTLQIPFPSAEAWRKLLAEQPRPRRSHVGYIGMAVHDGWHHQGVGSALLQAAISLAGNWLHLLRLELTVYTDNEVAVRLYKKHRPARKRRAASGGR
jgi:putative acetyltransferase